MSAFSLSNLMEKRLGSQPIVQLNTASAEKGDEQRYPKPDGKGSAQGKRQPKKSCTAIISFRYYSQAPQFSETLIRKLLQQYTKRNELLSVRIFSNKLYTDFKEVPDILLVHKTLQDYFSKCEVFVHYDVPNDRDLNTVYVGRIRGCDKRLLEKAALQYVDSIREVRIPQKGDRPQNFGYIECLSRSDAHIVASKLNGQQLGLTDALRAVLLVESDPQ